MTGFESVAINYILSQGSEVLIILVGLFLLWRRFKIEAAENHKTIAEKIESVATRANGFFDVFLDSMDFPAWVKRAYIGDAGVPEFRMHFINRAYEDRFNVSRVAYIGKTDHHIWNKQRADLFYLNDLEVLRKKNKIIFEELSTDGTIHRFKKFYVFYQGQHWIVGLALSDKELEHDPIQES